MTSKDTVPETIEQIEILEWKLEVHKVPVLGSIVWASMTPMQPCRVVGLYENGDVEVRPIGAPLDVFMSDWGKDPPHDGWEA